MLYWLLIIRCHSEMIFTDVLVPVSLILDFFDYGKLMENINFKSLTFKRFRRIKEYF